MRLYKMELYKLCHRKLFIIGAVCVIGILMLFFCIKVSDESAYVDGIAYRGYQAVQVNRRITEAFKGVLTDEKVEKIVEKYGFPQIVEERYYGFSDTNFLNYFVMEYFSDGYFYGWDDYKVASCVYPIEDTELGAVKKLTGRELILEYNNGWFVFLDVLVMGLMLGSVLVLFSVSITFSGESRSKMLQLLFTTKEGRKNDIYIKIAAAFTVTGIIWAVVVILDLLLCGAVFGFDGLECFVGATKIMFLWARTGAPSVISVGHFTMISLMRGFVGMMLLCAVVLYISASFKSSFYVITVSSVYFAAPFLIMALAVSTGAGSFFMRVLLSITRILQYISPLIMIMPNSVIDVYRIWQALCGIAVVACVLCVISAYRRYRRRQV